MAAPFARAVEMILRCGEQNGRVVVTGMGKSGIIAQKIAATLSSTGSPALFLHPAEAVHGDLGVLMPGDVVIALSASGETEEILRLLATVKRKGDALISFSCNLESTLALSSDVALDCSVEREACGLNPVSYTHLDVYKRQGQDVLDNLNPNSLEILTTAKLEPSLANAKLEDRFQFCLLYTSRCV